MDKWEYQNKKCYLENRLVSGGPPVLFTSSTIYHSIHQKAQKNHELPNKQKLVQILDLVSDKAI